MLPRRVLAVSLLAALSFGAAHAANIPRPSPEFAVDILGGKQVHVSQYRGKVVALLFFLTYCPHCQKTVEILSKDQNEFGPRGFQVISSAIEDMARMTLPDFIKRYNPPFPVGFNGRDPVLQYLQRPVMLQLLMPQLVFIDRQGVIRAQYSGDDNFFGENQEANIRAKIEELLGPPAKASANGAARSKKKK